MTRQFGSIFTLFGLLLLLIFLGTVQATNPAYSYGFVGLTLFLIGLWLRRRHYKPPPPPERFSLIKKMRNKNKKK